MNLLSPNWGLAFWLTLTFLILLFVLRRYAWGPIVSAMEEREKTIDSSIQRAEEALAEAKEIQADNEKARREAEQKAQRILREAREQAEQLRDEERQKTQEQIDEMKQQAHDEIEREKQSALNELRSEVADLAVQAAGKILHEDMNQDHQRRMVDEFLEDLPRN
ncbi:MAG: ATP synthase F0 subunit B [Bacteroidetes bacterium QS_8_64_10]|nr:MAG: ATP synthase F0 subunit B [Bacteroidetes bacterium QS_8_64_10]